jgi:hypothetical protein
VANGGTVRLVDDNRCVVVLGEDVVTCLGPMGVLGDVGFGDKIHCCFFSLLKVYIYFISQFYFYTRCVYLLVIYRLLKIPKKYICSLSMRR